MKHAKKLLAKLMVLTLVLAYIPTGFMTTSAASSKVSTKKYTLSQKAGTYSSTFKLKITAKKGYKVYYSTGSNLNIKKVIKSGKSKTITISKTTTLKIYAVKKSTIITKKKLKTSAVKKKTKSYKYVIKTENENPATDTADTTTATTAATTATTSDTSNATKTSETASFENGNTSEQSSETNTSSGNDSSSEESVEKPSSEEASTISTEKESVVISNEQKEVEFSISSDNENDEGITSQTTDNSTTVTVSSTGTYTLTGYEQNLHIDIDASDSSNETPVILNLDSVNVDNNSETSDDPIIEISKNTANVIINFSGESNIIGASAFTDSPAALISATNSSITLTGDEDAVVNLVDSMATDTDYTRTADDTTKTNDPVDGITAGKGTLTIESGTYNIYTNGDCLKGTGNKGAGGVVINGGTLNLVSYLSTAIKSKNGNITIADGKININSTADNAIQAKNYKVDISGGSLNISDCGKNAIKAGSDVTISGGAITVNDCKKDAINTDADVVISGATTKITIDKCYGDGIQGENIDIQNGTIDIKTYYEYAATNFYSTNWSGSVNSITESNTSKTETINYDTGSHKALKAGTKAETYSYKAISDSTATDSDGNALVAGQTYTQTSSGGLTISGGTITLDTRNTGIKYNGGSTSSGGNMGNFPGGAPGSGMVGGDSQSIIGSPDDAIHSNNTASISGGTITIYSSDDGITVANTLDITGSANIDIKTAYEGIESGAITIGTNDDSASQPTVSVYSNDDGINASKKTSTTYVYADENEETYTKTTISGSNNTLTVYGGILTVEIADDTTHSVTLNGTAKDGSGTQTYTFSADGDGIDCNGSFYAYGGTIITIGGTGNGNGVFDRDGSFVIGEGVTLFGIGTTGMIEGPTEVNQPYIQYSGSSSGGMGGNKPGSFGNSNSTSSSIASGSTITISDSTGNELFSYTTKKAASYILYSSPNLTNGNSYTLKSGTTTLSTLTATTSASSGGSGGNTPLSN